MSRRASSGMHPGLLVGVVVVVAALFFGGKALIGHKASPFEGSAKLSMDDFKNGGNSLRGNEYVVEGRVEDQRVNDMGRVLFLSVGDEHADARNKDFLAVKIPTDLTVQNIERNQRYAIKVRIEKQGVPVATSVTRL